MVDFNQAIQLTLANNKNFVMCGLRAYMDLMGLLKIIRKKIDENWCCGNFHFMFNIFQIYNELWDVIAMGCC